VQRLGFLVHNDEPADEMFLLGCSQRAFIVRGMASFVCDPEILGGEHAGRPDQAYQLFRASKRTPASVRSECHRATHTDVLRRSQPAGKLRERDRANKRRSCSVKLLFGG
jgi:uncharacterized protein (DUF2235 family)